MAGRGRGRGRGALNFEDIKRPGQENANLNTPESFIDRCGSDWHYATKAASQCAEKVAVVKDGLGTRFRAALLGKIQQLYKEKSTLRQGEPTKFLGSMALLCQILAKVRDNDGKPFSPLIVPVIEVLTMMLDEDSNTKEIECAATQLKDVLEVAEAVPLSAPQKDSLRKLRMNIRSIIINSRGTACIGSLLDATETICVLLNKVLSDILYPPQDFIISARVTIPELPRQ